MAEKAYPNERALAAAISGVQAGLRVASRPVTLSETTRVFLEAEMVALGKGPRSPLDLDVKLIVPGWGNKRDNNYYPATVLKRDAGVFVGAKMYATDHRENEKSVRTEVSRIKEITGFADDGAPIARVTIFDPDFAEQTRNRAQAGILDSLECSILAYGTGKPGKAPDGKSGYIVEAITAAQSVDWVTKAGAGGRALRLAESRSLTRRPFVPKVVIRAPRPKVRTMAEVERTLDTVLDLNAMSTRPGPRPQPAGNARVDKVLDKFFR
jgi:hypothetical protein